MTKQEIMEDYANFMASALEGKTFKYGEETCIILDAYMHGMVLVNLRPEWFTSEKLEPAYESLLEQLYKYRHKNGRSPEYNSLARAGGLLPEPQDGSVYGDIEAEHIELVQCLACPADLGLILSEDPKDRKFCRRVFAQYLRRGFNRPSVTPPALKSRPKNGASKIMEDLPSDMPPLNREARRALEKGQLPFPMQDLLTQRHTFNIKPPEPQVKDEKSEVADEKMKFLGEMSRYVIMLAGRVGSFSMIDEKDDWEYLELESGEQVINLDGKYAREAACLRPTCDACAFCQPEFRRLLSTIYYVRENKLPVEPLFKSGGEERERYFRMADAVVLPFLDLMDNQAQIEHATTGAAIVEASSSRTELVEAKLLIQALQSKLDEASKQTAISPEGEEELLRLREEAEKVQQAAKAQEEAFERLKEEAASLKQEKTKLIKALDESQSQYNIMNGQLLDLLEDKIDFVDDEIPEAPVPPAGIRAKIGEVAYERLSEARLAIVGGHDNTTASLRDLFPDWKFYPTNTTVPDGLTSVEAMAIITSYVSHKTFEQAKSVAKGINLRIIPVRHNGPVSICRALVSMLGPAQKEELVS